MQTVAWVNLSLFGFLIGVAILYTLFCMHKRQHQQKNDQFLNHLPLIAFNLFLLLVLPFFALNFFHRIFTIEPCSIFIFLAQFAVILVLDDAEFYLWHRLLHANKFLFRHIHRIHHRAIQPYPLDFIYVHPLEWMGGTLGIVAALCLIVGWFGSVNAYVFWAYGGIRFLRELDLHAGEQTFLRIDMKVVCNSLYHGLHHTRIKGNYASILNYWDKLLNTKLKLNIGSGKKNFQAAEDTQ